jgi:hypothetical protein
MHDICEGALDYTTGMKRINHILHDHEIPEHMLHTSFDDEPEEGLPVLYNDIYEDLVYYYEDRILDMIPGGPLHSVLMVMMTREPQEDPMDFTINVEAIRAELGSALPHKNPELLDVCTKYVTEFCGIVLDTLCGRRRAMDKRSPAMMKRWHPDTDGDLISDIEVRIVKDTLKGNNARKKEDARQLRENVNELDKQHGLRLRHPEKTTIDDRWDMRNAFAYIGRYIIRLIAVINSLDSEALIGDDGTIKEKTLLKFIHTIQFEKYDEPKNDNSTDYQIRYLSRLGCWIFAQLEVMAEVMYVCKQGSVLEAYEVKVDYAKEILKNYSLLIQKMLSGKDCTSNIMFFEELAIYIDSCPLELKKQQEKEEKIELQTASLHFMLKPYRRHDDEVAFDTILKLAYYTATNETNLKKSGIEFPEKYRWWKRKYARECIRDLGKHIRMSWKRREQCPQMYLEYMRAEPDIRCAVINDNKDNDLLIGVSAIQFYGFISGATRVQRYIRKILRC